MVYGKVERLLALEDGLRQDEEHPEVWRVKSLHSTMTYRVQVYEDGAWMTCTCPWGLNNLGRIGCYHQQAVERRLKGEG